MKKVIIVTVVFLVIVLSGCSSFKTYLDNSGLNDVSDAVLKDYKIADPGKLKKIVKNPDVMSGMKAYENVTFTVEPLSERGMKMPGGSDVTAEKISFESCLKRSDGSSDTAVFYYYKSPKSNGEKAILWVPGFGVSDFAFFFIKKFFEIALVEGYDVFFYVIPFHLDRLEKGKNPGEGLFEASAERNIETTTTAVCEIRTIINYLRQKGVKQIGSRSGSIGSSYIYLASSLEKLDHMSLMIPIVDWNTLFNNPAMDKVNEKNRKNGFTDSLITSAYTLISPINYRSLIPPDRIQVQYAKLDQLTPMKKTLEFAEKYSIKNITGYDESHSTILLNNKMFEDYAVFLKGLK